MKYLAIISITSILSSAGTFFYMTKEMSPEFYKKVISTASVHIDKIKDPSKYCQSGSQAISNQERHGRGVASENPQFGELIRQAQDARKEHNKILKEMENSK